MWNVDNYQGFPTGSMYVYIYVCVTIENRVSNPFTLLSMVSPTRCIRS